MRIITSNDLLKNEFTSGQLEKAVGWTWFRMISFKLANYLPFIVLFEGNSNQNCLKLICSSVPAIFSKIITSNSQVAVASLKSNFFLY